MLKIKLVPPSGHCKEVPPKRLSYHRTGDHRGPCPLNPWAIEQVYLLGYSIQTKPVRMLYLYWLAQYPQLMLGHDSGIASKVAGLQKQAKVPGNWYFNNEKRAFKASTLSPRPKRKFVISNY